MMRKVQKLISGVICFSLLFLTAATAFASPVPHLPIWHCPECYYGNVYRTVTEKFDGEIHRQHGSHYDIYHEYDVTIYEYCDSCSYKFDDEYEREDLIYCPSKK